MNSMVHLTLMMNLNHPNKLDQTSLYSPWTSKQLKVIKIIEI